MNLHAKASALLQRCVDTNLQSVEKIPTERGRLRMADENDTGASTEVVGTDPPAKAPAAKNQRAPRREKIAAEVVAPTDTTVKSKRVYRKKSDVIAAEAKP